MYHMWKELYNTQKIENTDDLPTDSVQYTTQRIAEGKVRKGGSLVESKEKFSKITYVNCLLLPHLSVSTALKGRWRTCITS